MEELIQGTDEADSSVSGAFQGLKRFYSFTGFANASSGNLIMIVIGIIFIYLGIKYDYEPLLLIPIGAGVIIGNVRSVVEVTVRPDNILIRKNYTIKRPFLPIK